MNTTVYLALIVFFVLFAFLLYFYFKEDKKETKKAPQFTKEEELAWTNLMKYAEKNEPIIKSKDSEETSDTLDECTNHVMRMYACPNYLSGLQLDNSVSEKELARKQIEAELIFQNFEKLRFEEREKSLSRLSKKDRDLFNTPVFGYRKKSTENGDS